MKNSVSNILKPSAQKSVHRKVIQAVALIVLPPAVFGLSLLGGLMNSLGATNNAITIILFIIAFLSFFAMLPGLVAGIFILLSSRKAIVQNAKREFIDR